MSRVENLVNTYWDRYVELSNLAVLLHIWSWTTPRCGMAGIFNVSRGNLADGRIPDDGTLQAVLDELEAAGLVFYRERVLWNRQRVAELNNRTEQIGKSIARDLREVEGTELHAAFIREYTAGKIGEWLGPLLPTLTTDPHHRPSDSADLASNGEVPTLTGDPTSQGQGPSQGQRHGQGEAAEDVEVSVDVGGEERHPRARPTRSGRRIE